MTLQQEKTKDNADERLLQLPPLQNNLNLNLPLQHNGHTSFSKKQRRSLLLEQEKDF